MAYATVSPHDVATERYVSIVSIDPQDYTWATVATKGTWHEAKELSDELNAAGYLASYCVADSGKQEVIVWARLDGGAYREQYTVWGTWTGEADEPITTVHKRHDAELIGARSLRGEYTWGAGEPTSRYQIRNESR